MKIGFLHDMKVPTHAEAIELLCLLAADEGRGPILFGNSVSRVLTVLRPFMIGKSFPSVYLEFPLAGYPYLDVNISYAELDANDYIDSDYAVDTEKLHDWFTRASHEYPDIAFGYTPDANKPASMPAGIYFQPREHSELVAPFCQAAGEPERAELYLNFAKRLPREWELAYLGIARCHAGSPLRVGGYFRRHKLDAEFYSAEHFARCFDRIGFTAYDSPMLDHITEMAKTAPGDMDFQFDIYPDGTLGGTFSLEAKFDTTVAEHTRALFEDGAGARVMDLLESWGAADERWKSGVEASLTRTVPVELSDGTEGRYLFILLPQWVKARWKDAKLQPAKFYYTAFARQLPQAT